MSDRVSDSLQYRTWRMEQRNPRPQSWQIPDSVLLGLDRKQVFMAQQRYAELRTVQAGVLDLSR